MSYIKVRGIQGGFAGRKVGDLEAEGKKVGKGVEKEGWCWEQTCLVYPEAERGSNNSAAKIENS